LSAESGRRAAADCRSALLHADLMKFLRRPRSAIRHLPSNWDKELAKIDKQLESMSDEALLPAKNAPTPAAKAEAEAVQTRHLHPRRHAAAAARRCARRGDGLLALSIPMWTVALCVPRRFRRADDCGIWSAIWTWRHRSHGRTSCRCC
jgi:hypothetical protein